MVAVVVVVGMRIVVSEEVGGRVNGDGKKAQRVEKGRQGRREGDGWGRHTDLGPGWMQPKGRGPRR